MLATPPSFLTHLREVGYDSRSRTPVGVLAEDVLDDLLARCPLLRKQASRGQVSCQLHYALDVGGSAWPCSLVVGRAPTPFRHSERMTGAAPTEVCVAVMIRAAMASHRGAIINRKRDFESHHQHVHRHNRRAIAAGLLVVNDVPNFVSSVRTTPVRASRSGVFEETLRFCVQQMRSVTSRTNINADGIDAKGLLMVHMPAQRDPGIAYVTAPPAPQPGDALHYDEFIHRICDEYTLRFGNG